MKYIRSSDVVLRKIHNSYFLIDLTDNYLDFECCLCEINEVGKFIWDTLSREMTIEEITDSLITVLKDDIEYLEVFNDIADYVAMLVGQAFVKEVETNG